jgi:ATP-dependent DNA helicase RecG
MPWFDKLFRPNILQQKALTKLGVDSVEKLLRHLPSRYDEPGTHKNIIDLVAGDEATIYGRILSAKTKKGWRNKIPMGEAVIEDETGKIKAIWFHQAYLAKKITEGSLAAFRGKVASSKNGLYLTNPEIIEKTSWLSPNGLPAQAGKETLFYSQNETDSLVPIYAETRGITSGWFYYHIKKLISEGEHEKLVDPIPEDILKKYNLPKLATALVWIHLPKKIEDSVAARKRFAFEEVFFIQLARLRDKKVYQSNPSQRVKVNQKDLKEFLDRFPFKPTSAQTRAINQIVEDFAKDQPMVRLLEGDVGSGKTMVAATTTFAMVKAGLEVSYMAPTEILARQHFDSFIKYFAHMNVSIGLITGKECKKFPSKIDPTGSTHISKSTLLKWVANGEIPIVVGTHALIQKQVKFKKLGLAIIDEQHRFGVMQRAKLVRRKNESKSTPLPHLLSMTATPIPRTLALTVFGDLDLTLLDEMPAGRKPIITEIISPDKRDEAYEHIRQELKAGRQAYVICPRIDEPDPDKEMAVQAKSAKAETVRLQDKVFPEFTVEVMHSKLKPKDKEDTMQQFTAGDIDILVSTSVIEVGVNVPNATIIIIEGAERFGLAQLHQLRGRVLRSNHQAYCYIFSETKSAKSMDRLKALVKAKNGFELAEHDLALRGSGTIVGGKQWGVSDIGMEAIKNIKMVEAARAEAEAIINADPDLSLHPNFLTRLSSQKQELHFE